MSSSFTATKALENPQEVRAALAALKDATTAFECGGDNAFVLDVQHKPDFPKMKLYRVLVGRVEFGVEVQTDNWFTFLDTTLNAPFSDPIYLGGTFGSLKQGLTTSYAGQAESLWGSATVKFVNSAATLEWNFTYYDKPYSGEKVLFSI